MMSCACCWERLRWGDAFECRFCGATDGGYWRMGDGLRRCAVCRRETSVTAGTIFHKSRLPLVSWFAAIWYVVNQKNGVSALGLQRVLGFGSYQTAWAWLHKLRRAMVLSGREPLTGAVEVDETLIGGVKPGNRRAQSGRQGASGDRGRVPGRRTWPHADAAHPERLGRRAQRLRPRQRRARQRGSHGRLERLQRHRALPVQPCDHEPGESGDPAHVAMPEVHRIASLLKRWLLGTHQGAVSHEQLDYYLDEFTFRFNRRRSRHRGLLFYRLLQAAVATDPQPYTTLISAQSTG